MSVVDDLRALRARELQEGREKTEPALQRFLASLPADANTLMAAAQEMCLQHRFPLSIELGERAVKLTPASQLRFTLAQIYYLARCPADAVAVLTQLIAEHGERFELLTELGIAHVAQGDTDAARDALDRAIAANQRWAPALHERVLLERVRDTQLVDQLEALASDAGKLAPEHVVQLHYARGKAWDDLGEHQRAFTAYAAGAVAFRAHTRFDESVEVRQHEEASRRFAGRAMARGEGDPGFLFIVGMPRTGTTMLEQIMLGDPRVVSVGETTALADAARGSGDTAREYALRLADYSAENAAIVLDKTTTNYLWAPQAVEALGARVVHCKRDVVDTCWSLYTTWFGAGTAWSYDFAEIARAYGRYARLMRHWRDVLGDAMVEVEYERLTAAPEETSKALFAQTGLDWRPEALEFAARPRTVITPSMAQVRKAVSAGSVKRVAPYLSMLEPLLDALRKEGL